MNWIIELTKKLKPFSQDRFLLAVSGGLDSVALFYVFLHFREHFNFQFSVAHFHHGPDSNNEQELFRFQAFEFVNNLCKDNQVEFFSNALDVEKEPFLKNFPPCAASEEAFRKRRYAYLEGLLKESGFDHLVLAHHQDDLLETRLLRLLRGTGPEGLKSMSFIEAGKLRPLLEVRREELQNYVNFKQGIWLEDPSNKNSEFLRNWLRNKWLPELEEKCPGSLESLNRSLDLLVAAQSQPVNLDSFLDEKGFKLNELWPLDKDQRRQIMAAYMKSQGLRNYGLSHINEALKRLDREEKSHSFKLLGLCWKVDAGRMNLSEPS